MPSTNKYTIGSPPLQDPIVGRLFLTDAWRNWFADLQNQYLVTWDDLRFPSVGINLPGAASDPTRNTTTGMLMFSGVLDNIIAGAAQMPHTWLEGSTVRPHIHVAFPTAAVGVNTRWQFEYNRGNVAGNFEHALGTYTAMSAVTVANPNNVLGHVYGALGDLSMTGMKASAMILWRVSRLAATDAADDDPNACALLEFDIHFQHSRTGTVPER